MTTTATTVFNNLFDTIAPVRSVFTGIVQGLTLVFGIFGAFFKAANRSGKIIFILAIGLLFGYVFLAVVDDWRTQVPDESKLRIELAILQKTHEQKLKFCKSNKCFDLQSAKRWERHTENVIQALKERKTHGSMTDPLTGHVDNILGVDGIHDLAFTAVYGAGKGIKSFLEDKRFGLDIENDILFGGYLLNGIRETIKQCESGDVSPADSMCANETVVELTTEIGCLFIIQRGLAGGKDLSFLPEDPIVVDYIKQQSGDNMNFCAKYWATKNPEFNEQSAKYDKWFNEYAEQTFVF